MARIIQLWRISLYRTFRLLEERGGTLITDVQRFSDDGGTLAMFSITTPFGDTTFRFVERRGYSRLFPGFVPTAGRRDRRRPAPTGNRFGFERIDHLTANFQTMKPALLWMEHVLGFEQMWEIAFHTQDVASAQKREHGSGLKSIVMWDPPSGVKFANNEPFRPFFKESQINLFAEDNRGDGIQHSALSVRDIVGAVRGLRAAGVEFMPTPGSYFDVLPERLGQIGVGTIDESVDLLRELEILVDGGKPHQYLLQIFLKEAAGRYHDPEAGPFFFEIIQRKGDQGFGAGNFRALFEAIEREQARGKINESQKETRCSIAWWPEWFPTRRTRRCATKAVACATRSASRAAGSTGRTPSCTTSIAPTPASR